MAVKPNPAQLTASDPNKSVWVSASAGSGKTKVLTDRVIRLLLAGVPPSKILCITYTKAAAIEMRNRINNRLSKWVMLKESGEDGLAEELRNLTGKQPDNATIRQARNLFATLLDDNIGLRIQTIHSFCQSALERFPLEAGIAPSSTILDERSAADLLNDAKITLIEGKQNYTDEEQKEKGRTEDNILPTVREAIECLSEELGEYGFSEIVDIIIANYEKYVDMLQGVGKREQSARMIWEELEIPLWYSEKDARKDILTYSDNEIELLHKTADILEKEGSDVEQEKADKIRKFINIIATSSTDNDFSSAYDDYREIFLKADGNPRKEPVKRIGRTTVKLGSDSKTISSILQEEQHKITEYEGKLKAIKCAELNSAILCIAEALIELYNQRKRVRAALDYNDLIRKAHNLICKSGDVSWVLYKLDGNIEHILVDEAQDTSPIQWDIIKTLAEEFFTGHSAAESSGADSKDGTRPSRTIFVVGDEKQSIYSFQGADVKNFVRMREIFTKMLENVNSKLEIVNLDMSFRSTPEVLQAVDRIFTHTNAKKGVTGNINDEIKHISFRSDKVGYVELIPLIDESHHYHQKEENSS